MMIRVLECMRRELCVWGRALIEWMSTDGFLDVPEDFWMPANGFLGVSLWICGGLLMDFWMMGFLIPPDGFLDASRWFLDASRWFLDASRWNLDAFRWFLGAP